MGEPRPADFDARYREDADPFGVRTRWYERRKTAGLLAVLAQERYALAWDAACGVGQVTEALAGRCDRVVASDASARAVELTRELTSADALVSALPEVPEAAAEADLVVLSEVLYYLPADDRAAVARRVDALPRAAEVVAVSWRAQAEDTWLSGSDSLVELGRSLGPGWQELAWWRDVEFEIRSWTR
jgi:SAM-dependent methyltransferase